MNAKQQVVAPTVAQWTLMQLANLSRADSIALFKTLPAPSYQEMNGEFDGHIPEYHREIWHATHDVLAGGRWLGKAYRVEPYRHWPAHGYNRISMPGKVMRQARFAWSIKDSDLDGHPSLVMQYSAFDQWCGQQDLIDEVRKAAEGLYLGLYHTREPVPGFTSAPGNDGRSALQVFILTGPVGSWVGHDAD